MEMVAAASITGADAELNMKPMKLFATAHMWVLGLAMVIRLEPIMYTMIATKVEPMLELKHAAFREGEIVAGIEN